MRAEAARSDEEIRRVRQPIQRVVEEVDRLTDDERAEIRQAAAVVRKTRQGFLRMPRIRQHQPDPRPELTRMTSLDPSVQAMVEGRRAGTDRRCQRVLTALAAAGKDGSDSEMGQVAARYAYSRPLRKYVSPLNISGSPYSGEAR
ncbi:hypothetical protein ABTZ59_36060 [Streptomyces sp. NPDC094034]|uniref:hypothetical protein n=1 Tax=Streptomyces sp. NPDC094034 TaxID=3155309 RepID=UPI0033246F44